MSFALANHPALLTREDQFITLDGGRKLIFPTAALSHGISIEVSRRQIGFNIHGQSHIVIDGFQIEGFVGGPRNSAGGISINNTSAARDVTISRNVITDTASYGRSAVLSLSFIDGLNINDNRIARHLIGRGISLYKSRNVSITRNDISDLTFTGILSITNNDVDIGYNRIRNVNGVHGNGIAIYLANRDVRIHHNDITESIRPVTFHGADDNMPIGLKIYRNRIWATGPASRAALQSWGRAIDVEIRSNLLLAEGGVGVDLRDSDRQIMLRRNIIDSLVLGRLPRNEITGAGNVFTKRRDNVPELEKTRFAPRLRTAAVAAFTGPPAGRICEIVNSDEIGPPHHEGGLGSGQACSAAPNNDITDTKHSHRAGQ
nr:right-handed parallel beta-helix repeat-containing protein [Sphingomonas lycopersici]